jgi:hypothetical protein
MLVIHGARERTRDELAGLLAAAGFEVVGVTPTVVGLSLVEARPV